MLMLSNAIITAAIIPIISITSAIGTHVTQMPNTYTSEATVLSRGYTECVGDITTLITPDGNMWEVYGYIEPNTVVLVMDNNGTETPVDDIIVNVLAK